MYEVVKISDSTTAAAPQNGVSRCCALQSTCCDRIPFCRKRISEKYPQTSLQWLWKCYGRQKHSWSVGERVTVSETGEAEARWLPRSGRPVTTISPEMPQHADANIHEDWRITTRRLALSQQRKSQWHHPWSRIFEGVHKTCSSEPLSRTQPREKPVLPSCWHVSKLRERLSCSGLLQQVKPGSIILDRGQKSNPWNSTILDFLGRTYSKSLRQRARSWLPSSGTVKEWFLWLWCREGTQSTPPPASGRWKNSGSVSN